MGTATRPFDLVEFPKIVSMGADVASYGAIGLEGDAKEASSLLSRSHRSFRVTNLLYLLVGVVSGSAGTLIARDKNSLTIGSLGDAELHVPLNTYDKLKEQTEQLLADSRECSADLKSKTSDLKSKTSALEKCSAALKSKTSALEKCSAALKSKPCSPPGRQFSTASLKAAVNKCSKENVWGTGDCDVSNWDVSKVTSMRTLFYKNKKFNEDVSSWDTSSVTDMGAMFSRSYKFNQDISNWDTSAVKDMGAMFKNALGFDQDLTKWNTNAVKNMQDMFRGNGMAFQKEHRLRRMATSDVHLGTVPGHPSGHRV